MVQNLTAGVTTLDFQAGGLPVQRVILDNGTMSVTLLSLGATLQDLRLAGVSHSLTLGSPDVSSYCGVLTYFGAIVGPVANRISGAAATLGGTQFHFEPNDHGRTCLHSGSTGTHAQVWDIGEVNNLSVVFELSLPDGTGGFPGNRVLAARFALTGPRTLELQIAATTDADTWINFANHSYWNLDGTETYAGHQLRIGADRYCVTDAAALVTGDAIPVADSPYDFRQLRALLPGQDAPIDHNFCLADGRRPTTEVATLIGASGISMTVETTEPGLQVYDAARLETGGLLGHNGHPLGRHAGLAIEAQGWPDAPNQPQFPSVVLRAGYSYEQITRWRFAG